MNVAFISHCDFNGNSAMHIFSVANVLTGMGVDCVVCVPNDARTIETHGKPEFKVVAYSNAMASGLVFKNQRGPDLVHAWTPRELVRKLTERLVEMYACPYIVHLEDNEEIIVETELGGRRFRDLAELPLRELDVLIPEHRTHPLRSKSFLQNAAAITALMDRLLEFKPQALPSVVFWPGFDEMFLTLQSPSADLISRTGLEPGERALVYNGNVHQTNAREVRSLFLAVQALRRAGVPVRLLKTGWNHVDDKSWIHEAVESGAVADLGFLPRAELPGLLSLASVLVQPGRSDRFNDYRFPSKLPEFLISGKPVVLPAANVGRFLRDDIDAVLLHYGNAVEIAQKVERLLADGEAAGRIGEAGRAFAVRRLSWAKNVPPLKGLYEETLRASRTTVSRAPLVEEPFHTPDTEVRLIAFFLPQFHPTAENDTFWGKGFTEWTNVAAAKPNFEGHYQPQVPADLGFYDLRLPETLESQAALAREYGIHGFCFYYYWFNGRKVLERPLEQMLRTGTPDFPFCICWANENWTRAWDGSETEILIEQDYSGDACERLIRDLIPVLKHPRYLRVGGAPMILVYRVNLLPDPVGTSRKWRDICRDAGLPTIHLCAVQSFGISDPRPYGFDAAVEFPPHTPRALIDPNSFPGIRQDFEGYLEDYPTILRNQVEAEWSDYTRYCGVMPAWDNTPRRGTRAHILVNSSSEQYEEWLYQTIRKSLGRRNVQEPIVFINAWNEWAEGAYLEPDQKHGRRRLQATRNALRRATAPVERPAATRETTAFPPPNDEHLAGRAPLGPRSTFHVDALSYGTARDYCHSFDNLPGLATANGDLKDCQRPWVVKAIQATIPPPARLLEIGAGEPLVAEHLRKLGYQVCIVDPYDGSGNGPQQYEEFRSLYPHLRFVRAQFDDQLADLRGEAYDCIYSVSVLEHIPSDLLRGVFAGTRRFLKPAGYSIHAVDHVHRGNGSREHLENLRIMARGFGFQQSELDEVLARMDEDVETYYLSTESHNRWRGAVPYDEFPMRVCVSIQFAVPASVVQVP